MVGAVSKPINLSSCPFIARLTTVVTFVLLGCWPLIVQCQSQTAIHDSLLKKSIDSILSDPKFAGSFIGIDIEASGLLLRHLLVIISERVPVDNFDL